MKEQNGKSLVEQAPNLHYSSSSDLLPHDPPPVDKLPTEIMQDIFTLACPKVVLDPHSTSVPFPLELGLVCTKWRAVVAAHRSLWADFKINVQGRWSPKCGMHLRNYLQQSGTRPLTIKVRMSWVGSDAALVTILDAMVAHCERWETIKLDFPLDCRFLMRLAPVRDRLPILQRLRVMGPRNPYYDGARDLAILRNTPSLNRLSVLDVDEDTDRVLALPWNRVSRATLDFPSFRKLQSSLEQSQALTTLTLTEECCDDWHESLKLPVIFKNLQVLRVHDELGVGNFICPSLRHLELMQEDSSDICKLMDNSACALAHLELHGFGRGTLSPIVQHASLARLTFLYVTDHWVSDGGLNILVLDSQRLLPLLETLCVDVELQGSTKKAKRSFKSLLRSLQWIVESRTYDRKGEEGTLSELNSTAEHAELMPLKEFHVTFTESSKGLLDKEGAALQLYSFLSFCNSREVLSVLRTEPWV